MLTTEQLTTLKAAILAETDSAFVAARTANNEQGMADWYNGASTFFAWRSSVTRSELQDMDSFNWTVVDNLATGSKFRIWEWMFEDTGSFNPSKANIRAGIAACWVGNAALVAVQAAILAACKRVASKVEQLFATGTGTELAPGTFGFEGAVTAQDISDALRA